MSKSEKKEASSPKVLLSIGAKLVIIITILVLVSLGTITGLVSYLVRQDLQVSAEYNNFEVNRRSAFEIENNLENLKSNAVVFIDIINAAGPDSDLARNALGSYLSQNTHVVSLLVPIGNGNEERLLVNYPFFTENQIDSTSVKNYIEKNADVKRRAAAGGTFMLNASVDFGVHLLALFFPRQEGGAGVVLFSPEKMNESITYGTNETFLINDEDDVLLHEDGELVQIGANMSNMDYIRMIRERQEKNMQGSYEIDGVNYFVAYTKLDIGACIVFTSIEYDKVFEGIEATTRRNLYLTAAVLGLSILFIWFFSKTISTPIKALAEAAKKIEGGSFDIDLTAKGHDEIGILTGSFNKMSSALSIFGKFTNREIAVKAMRNEISPGGEEKHATIFFSDIRGFTEKSENFTKYFKSDASDRIVHWLNAYFTQMIDCIEKTGGVVDKFIGDAVMAHWGTAYTTGSPRKDALSCIKAALMMRMALAKLNNDRKPGDPGDPPIVIGAGINTGIVTAGQLGSDMRMEYTVIGDPVNLASRTESLNKPFGTDILITEDTWRLTNDQLITEEMPSVTVKGKEKPVRMFAVINFNSIKTGPQTLDEVRRLLGINPPDLSNVDINAEEKKYKIGQQK